MLAYDSCTISLACMAGYECHNYAIVCYRSFAKLNSSTRRHACCYDNGEFLNDGNGPSYHHAKFESYA